MNLKKENASLFVFINLSLVLLKANAQINMDEWVEKEYLKNATFRPKEKFYKLDFAKVEDDVHWV